MERPLQKRVVLNEAEMGKEFLVPKAVFYIHFSYFQYRVEIIIHPRYCSSNPQMLCVSLYVHIL